MVQPGIVPRSSGRKRVDPGTAPRFRMRRMSGGTFTIGEAAKRAGVSPDTLRYYERVGLIGSAPRGTNGYRSLFRGTRRQGALHPQRDSFRLQRQGSRDVHREARQRAAAVSRCAGRGRTVVGRDGHAARGIDGGPRGHGRDVGGVGFATRADFRGRAGAPVVHSGTNHVPWSRSIHARRRGPFTAAGSRVARLSRGDASASPIAPILVLIAVR